MTVPNQFCAGLQFHEDVAIADSQTDRFEWNDSDCQPRSAARLCLPRGYVRQYTYMYDGKLRTATGTGVNGHMAGASRSITA